jgi:hypothetical protein
MNKFYWKMLWNNIRRIPQCLYNFWRFRKEVYNFQPWDYRYNIELFRASLSQTADYIEKNKRYTEWERDVNDIRMFLECTNDKNFYDVCKEYDEYLSNLDYKFIPFDEKSSELIFINNSKISEERAEQLTKRANMWEQARWNRAWNLVRDRMTSWWD